MRDDRAGRFIHSGTEPRKGLQLLELRKAKLEVARDRAVGRPLRLAADARDGLADIDRWQHAQFEQRGRQIDLPVGDRDQIGRDIGRDVLGLGLDDRQGGERTPAALRTQVGGALQQARVDVEDIAGEGLAAGRAAQQ